MPKNKFEEIYKVLKQNIINKTYQGMLPTEHQLTKEFKCSRNTIRRAVNQLNMEGYVKSVHGKGVVILEELDSHNLYLNIRDFAGIRSVASRQNLTFTTSVLTFKQITIDEELAKVTLFKPGTEAYHIIRLRYINDVPKVLDINYFACKVVKSLTVEIAQSSIYEYIEKQLQQKILSARRIISIQKADEKDKEHLLLKDFDCIGVIQNNAYIEDGSMFEYTESHFTPENFVFMEHVMR